MPCACIVGQVYLITLSESSDQGLLFRHVGSLMQVAASGVVERGSAVGAAGCNRCRQTAISIQTNCRKSMRFPEDTPDVGITASLIRTYAAIRDRDQSTGACRFGDSIKQHHVSTILSPRSRVCVLHRLPIEELHGSRSLGNLRATRHGRVIEQPTPRVLCRTTLNAYSDTVGLRLHCFGINRNAIRCFHCCDPIVLMTVSFRDSCIC